MTKKYSRLSKLFAFLSFLLMVGPLASFTISAFITSTVITEKVMLTMTLFIVLIMSLVAWFNKITLRSRVWVIIIGLYFILDSFIAPLLIIGSCQIVDEWFISPIHKHYKNLYIINKEIDKRIP